MPSADRSDPWWWVLVVFALGNAANAVWMLADPGRVVRRACRRRCRTPGPLNTHFVRDIGSAFARHERGAALRRRRARRSASRCSAIVSMFYVLHALVHVTDTLAGRLPPSHWAIDAPGVYVPALLLARCVTVGPRRAHGCAA